MHTTIFGASDPLMSQTTGPEPLILPLLEEGHWFLQGIFGSESLPWR